MPWYFAESGLPVGPVDDEEFDAYVANGRIKPDMLVWRRGMAQWQPYASVNGASAVGLAERPPVAPGILRWCSECRNAYPLSDLAAFGGFLVCPNCKPLFTQKLREGVPAPGTPPYAGFWNRFMAIFMDGMILSVIALFYTVPLAAMFRLQGMLETGGDPARMLGLQLILMGIGFVVGLAYETWFVGRFGATPGKLICRIRVVRSDGGRLGYLRALARHLAKTLDWFTLGIGFLMAAFDDERRTLHDRICDTRVMRYVPDPLQISGGCPECHGPLPAEIWNLYYPARCPSCRAILSALAFPAQVQEHRAGFPEPAVEGGEATCFFHARNKAFVACDQCGRFLCTLCQVPIAGQNWCPSCIVLQRRHGRLAWLDKRRVMYDNLALLLALGPIVLLPFWPLAIITAPATIVVVFVFWRKLSSLVPRTKARFVVAGVLAGIELVALVFILMAAIANWGRLT
jgi:uncharacterized RDD family membrane protein YckC